MTSYHSLVVLVGSRSGWLLTDNRFHALAHILHIKLLAWLNLMIIDQEVIINQFELLAGWCGVSHGQKIRSSTEKFNLPVIIPGLRLCVVWPV